MLSISHLDNSFLTFQSPFVSVPAIAAFVVLAALYAARSDTNPSIPLYVPEKSAAGNLKKRWMFDSVNLLQEAYKKVCNGLADTSLSTTDHGIVLRQAFQGLDNRRESSCYSTGLCG